MFMRDSSIDNFKNIELKQTGWAVSWKEQGEWLVSYQEQKREQAENNLLGFYVSEQKEAFVIPLYNWSCLHPLLSPYTNIKKSYFDK